MVRVHTAQLNVGKKIPNNGNIVFLNTTAKSGQSSVEKALAPTWEMVSMYKSKRQPSDGRALEDKYTDMYLKHLDNMPPMVVAYFEQAAKGVQGFTDVIVSCYCGKDVFCHRHLLMRYLVERFGFEAGWEVINTDVKSVTSPNGSILSISESPDCTDVLLKEVFADEIERGEIVLIDDAYVTELCKCSGGHIASDTDCSLERAMLNWLTVSKVTKLKDSDGPIPITYIDTTRLVDTMFTINPSSQGETLVPKDNLGELVQGYLNRRAIWKAVSLDSDTVEMSRTVKRFGYVTHVTLDKSHENVDHDACMDTYYQIAKG